MRKKGFTLVELLAVIVVLAITALIATPLVLNTIEDARKGAFEQSLKNIVKASGIYQSREDFEIVGCNYFSFSDDVDEVTVRDDKTYYPIKVLELKGDLPTEGEIKICSEEIKIEVGNNNYSGSYNDKDGITIAKGDLASNDLTKPIIEVFTVTPTTTTLIVSVTAHSQSTGGKISKYYYKLSDDQGNTIKNATTENSGHEFEDLTPNTEYKVTVKVENGSEIFSDEKEMTITTNSFEAIVITTSKPGEWETSKTVTITGDELQKIEYQLIKAGIEGEWLEYKESFELNEEATNENPTIVKARYVNMANTEVSLNITKIDTSDPSLETKEISKTTNSITVPFTATDLQSDIKETTCVYGKDTDYGSTGTVNDSKCIINGLEDGETYYYKITTTNNAELSTEVTGSNESAPFGTCSVEITPSGWQTSKIATIKGETIGAQLQYKVNQYNETEGKVVEGSWTNISSGGTVNLTALATTDYPTTVYCRFNDGVNTTDGSTQMTTTTIDPSAPTDTQPSVVASTTKPTSQAIVTLKQKDDQSGLDTTKTEYGYSTSANGTYTWQTSSTFTNLNSDTTYYFKTKVTNNAGSTTTSAASASYTPGKITSTCTITGISSGWSTSKTATISGSQTGTTLQYKVNQYNETEGKVVEGSWTNISSGGTVNLTALATTDYPTTVYCQLTDGTNTKSGASQTITAGIDPSAPTNTQPSVVASTTKPTSQAIITLKQKDDQSGLDTTKTEYGYSTSANGTYTWQTSSTFANLNSDTTYYFKTKVTNNAGSTTTSAASASYTPAKITSSCTITGISSGWSTSKTATISGSQTGTTLQYKVDQYDETEGKVVEGTWTNISSGGTVNLTALATADYPTKVYCQLTDGTNTKSGATQTITAGIDPSKPSFSLSSTTKTTSSIKLTFDASDGESGISGTTCVYGETATYGSTGTVSGNTCTLSGLEDDKNYYYRLVTTNGAGTTATLSGGTTTNAIGTASIALTNTPTSAQNGYYKKQVATITYSGSTISSPIYYVKTTKTGTASVATTSSCGTGDAPSTCTTVSSRKNLVANTWYKFTSKPTITYDTASSTGTVYVVISDGKNLTEIAEKALSKIDATAPDLSSVSVQAIKSNYANVYASSTIDSESKVPSSSSNWVCSYGTTSGTYNQTGTFIGAGMGGCKFSGLTASTKYYYKICATDNVGNQGCTTGNFKTLPTTATLTFDNTPDTIQNGYYKNQVVTINSDYSEFYVKSTITTTAPTPTHSCGTGTEPENCTTHSGSPTIAADTWYKFTSKPTIYYSSAASSTGTIYVIASDGTNLAETASATLDKIDATAPDLSSLAVQVLKSNTATLYATSTIDSESKVPLNTSNWVCTYGTTSGTYNQTGSFTGASNGGCVFNGLTASTKYYYRICATDNVGNQGCKTGNFTTIEPTKATLTFDNTPDTIQNGYYKSQVVTINSDYSEFYVKSTRAATAPTPTHSCGTGTEPGTCTTHSGSPTLTASTWYKFTSKPTIYYNSAATSTGTLYVIASDGTNLAETTSATIDKIDINAPTLSTISTSTTSSSLVLTYSMSDTGGSNLGTPTCKYSNTSGSYTTNGSSVSTTSCTIPISSSTSSGSTGSTSKTYYYQVCAVDGVGNQTCKTGSYTS